MIICTKKNKYVGPIQIGSGIRSSEPSPPFLILEPTFAGKIVANCGTPPPPPQPPSVADAAQKLFHEKMAKELSSANHNMELLTTASLPRNTNTIPPAASLAPWSGAS